MTAAISAAVLLLSVLGAGRAHAQSAEAEALFTDGNKLMSAGKFPQACEAFEASNRAEPRAGTLLRLAACREQNQQLASAWSAYKDALGRAKDPQKRDYAAAQVAALEARVSYLTVSVPDDLQIEGLTLTRNGKVFDPALWNRALPVDGGDYIITGDAPGYAGWQTTAHVPVEHARITVQLPRLDRRTAPGTPPGSAPAPHDGDASSSTLTAKRKVALGAAGTGVIGVAAGAVLGWMANKKHDDARGTCPDPTACDAAAQANQLNKSGQHFALAANIMYGVGAAAAIAAGVLWFTGGASVHEQPARLSVVPRVAPGETGILIFGRF